MAVVLADAAAERAWYYSKGESGRRLLVPPVDAFGGRWGLPQSLNAVPRLDLKLWSRPCRRSHRKTVSAAAIDSGRSRQ